MVGSRPGLLLARVPVEDLLTLLARQSWRVSITGRVMAREHVRVHAHRAPSTLPDLHTELAGRIEAAAVLPPTLQRFALDTLDRLPRGTTLCHGDFHLGNLIGDWRNPIVLDWADAACGPAEADVARTLLLHRVGSPVAGAAAPVRAAMPLVRRLVTASSLDTYRRIRPLDRLLLRHWIVPRAAARFIEPVDNEFPQLERLLWHASGTRRM